MLTKIPKHKVAIIRKLISHSCDGTRLVISHWGSPPPLGHPGTRLMGTLIYNVWHVKNVSYTLLFICVYTYNYLF